jgi:uncharacterized membrane protein YdjX (TVP38/TMEM64 family)
MHTRHNIKGYVVLTVALLFLALLPLVFSNLGKFADPVFVRNLILSSGGFGYILLVLLVLGSIPLPIPSAAAIVAGGFVYGTFLGSLLSLIGIVLGSSISFLLVKHFGRPLLEKLTEGHHINHFNKVFKKRGLAAVLISYAIPIFPSDAVSAMLGLTKTSYRTFLILATIGHIPRVLLINSLGDDFLSGFSVKTVIIIVLCVLFVIIAAFREKLKTFFFKELHVLEKDIKKLEQQSIRDANIIGTKVKKFTKKR